MFRPGVRLVSFVRMPAERTLAQAAGRSQHHDGICGQISCGEGELVAARLADIAAQAGVSEATVSRVLNGKPGVSTATRQAVMAALDLMGYERPPRLRQRSNGLVGLVTPELDNPIFPAFAQSIEKALTQHGYTPVLCTQLPGGAPEDEFTELLVDRGVSGIVFVSGLHADTTARMDRY